MRLIGLFIILTLFLVACGAEDVPELEPTANFTEVPPNVTEVADEAENETGDSNETEANETVDNALTELEAKREEIRIRGTNFTKLPPNIREYTFIAPDTILLYGTQWKRDSGKYVILLPMLGKDRSTYNKLAELCGYE